MQAVHAYGKESHEFPLLVFENERNMSWEEWKLNLRQFIRKIYS